MLILAFSQQIFAEDSASQTFSEKSYELLTNNNKKLTLKRAVEILDNKAEASEEEDKQILELANLAFKEGRRFNDKKLEELQKLLNTQKIGFWVAPTPWLGVTGSSLYFYTSYGIELPVWLLGGGFVVGAYYLFYKYPKEAYFEPKSKIQESTRRIITSVLLAKIQLRIYEKDEGFPWPFADKPTCDQSLNDTLNKYKLK